MSLLLIRMHRRWRLLRLWLPVLIRIPATIPGVLVADLLSTPPGAAGAFHARARVRRPISSHRSPLQFTRWPFASRPNCTMCAWAKGASLAADLFGLSYIGSAANPAQLLAAFRPTSWSQRLGLGVCQPSCHCQSDQDLSLQVSDAVSDETSGAACGEAPAPAARPQAMTMSLLSME